MKKALLLGAALMLIAGSASAQYMGLYTDATHSEWCVENGVGVVTVYVFGGPTVDGMECLELSTTTSGDGTFMAFAPTWHPDVVDPKMGGFPDENLAACWGSCWDDWQWLLNAGLYLTNAEPITITIGAFTGSPYPKILTCQGLEIEAYPMTNFCINQTCCPPINAVEESSWGAIKNLYE